MSWCEANRVDFVFGLARNPRLVEQIHVALAWAEDEAERTGRPARRFADFRWRTRESWSRRRRVVAKAEWMPGRGAAGAKPMSKGFLYRLLGNRVYLGEAVHKGTSYPGEHDAIIDRALWAKVHAILKESPRKRAARTRAQIPALLKGLIFGPTGAAMSPTHTRRGDRLYRYYVSQAVLKRGRDACPVGRVPAAEIEAAVIDQLRAILRQPEIIVGTWRATRQHVDDLTEAEVREALLQLDPLWDELFPAEQARLVQLLVERVDVQTDGVAIRLRVDGLASLVRELGGASAEGRRAA